MLARRELAAGDEDDPKFKWVYFAGEAKKKLPAASQLLDEHLKLVASAAADLARHLDFDERLIRVFEWAGQRHDQGKDRPVWQRAARNFNEGPALAKSAWLDGHALGGYRHELGSILDAEAAEAKSPTDFSKDERDLALHLIAAHHGFSRPHFPDRAYDKSAARRSAGAAIECARRFSRLQHLHGAWGLAYLEAVFRSADAIVSAASEGTPSNA